jgi:N-acetylglutamate synthase/N-acetylornithine aminotransferase
MTAGDWEAMNLPTILWSTNELELPRCRADFIEMKNHKFRPITARRFLAGVFCDIKRLSQQARTKAERDLALIVSEVPSTVAGMFTTNQICAHRSVCIRRVQAGRAQSTRRQFGNANAREAGLASTREMASFTERALICRGSALVGSTVVSVVPMDNVARNHRSATLLGSGAHAAHAAEAS